MLQFPSFSTNDYDRLIALEEKIESGLGDLGIVDGHDMSSGEVNIFFHTDNPRLAFDRSKILLGAGENLRDRKAGYRGFNDDEYTAIHPAGLERFSVL